MHTLPSSQFNVAPPQIPPAQVSLVVHAFPSLQDAELLACSHPRAESQRSSVQGFWSLQFGGGPPRHVPPEQVSLVVQAFPSLHGLLLFTWRQPWTESQESSVQTFASSQLGAGPPTHTPPEQASFVVQAFPSLHWALLFV